MLRARDHAGAAYAYPGVQIAHPRMFENAPEGPFSTNLMWDRAIASGRLFGTVLDGVWIHVGTPDARDEAEAYLPGCAGLKHPNVFTIAPSAPFAETLARGLIARAGDDPLALSSSVIYLPTRRAARSFGDAFARVLGGSALLPQFRAAGRQRGRRAAFRRRSGRPGVEARNRAAAPPVAAGRSWCGAGTAPDRGGSLSFTQCAALADSLAKRDGRSGDARAPICPI